MPGSRPTSEPPQPPAGAHPTGRLPVDVPAPEWTVADVRAYRALSAGAAMAVLGYGIVFRSLLPNADDPFYANGFVPSVKQLVQRILTGQ